MWRFGAGPWGTATIAVRRLVDPGLGRNENYQPRTRRSRRAGALAPRTAHRTLHDPDVDLAPTLASTYCNLMNSQQTLGTLSHLASPGEVRLPHRQLFEHAVSLKQRRRVRTGGGRNTYHGHVDVTTHFNAVLR